MLNKFFDPSTPSMRKGCDGEKWKKKRKQAEAELCQAQVKLQVEMDVGVDVVVEGTLKLWL